MLTVLTQKPLFSTDKPSDAHHLRHVQPRALGRKASDEFAVPLCRPQHRAVHRVGDERARWQTAGVDALKAARKLWKHTRVNEGRIRLEPTIRAGETYTLPREMDREEALTYWFSAEKETFVWEENGAIATARF